MGKLQLRNLLAGFSTSIQTSVRCEAASLALRIDTVLMECLRVSELPNH